MNTQTQLHPIFYGQPRRLVEQKAVIKRQRHAAAAGIVGGFHLKDGKVYQAPCVQDFLLAETRFFRVRGEHWSPNPFWQISTFPFQVGHPEGDIVPLAGDIYVDKRKLTDEELGKVGLSPIKDEKGDCITSPYFCSRGTRVIMDGERRSLPVFGQTVDEGDKFALLSPRDFPFLPLNVNQYGDYFDACVRKSGQTLQQILDQVRAAVFAKWDRAGLSLEGNDLEVYRQARLPGHLMAWIVEQLGKENLAETMPSASLQFKGAGGHYIGRPRFFTDAKEVALLPGEIIAPANEFSRDGIVKMRMVGYPELFGSFGVFLDQIHQEPPASPDPVGGMLEGDTKAIELDRLFFNHGAKMAGISLSAIRLLQARAIRQTLGVAGYGGGDLYVLARVAGDDTRRLTHIQNAKLYQLYITQEYFPDLAFAAGRLQHLKLLAFNLGCNIRAAFDCGLTAKPSREIQGQFSRPTTPGNLDPTGKIYDSTELGTAEKPLFLSF